MDHLVYGVPDLTKAIEQFEAKTGVRARFGGQHPGRGTHNALLSLGGRHYLEIIAVDPEQGKAPIPAFPGLDTLTQPKLIAWATAVKSVAETAKRALAADIKTTGPLEGSRAQTDGSLLRWKTLRIVDAPVEGLPFFIEWPEDTLHPSQSSPTGCKLLAFEMEHTNPEQIRGILGKLGADAAITAGAQVRLKARLHTPKGEVELR
jgi:hypothetical protein